MAKIHLLGDAKGNHLGWVFWCPACDSAHQARAGAWTFNGDMDRPSFAPSLRVTYNGPDHDRPGRPPATCHSVVTNGRIAYQNDCTHAMRSQTVDVPEFPDGFHVPAPH